ncbi:coth protein-domain-containing protein [Syncephalastrum racemosum]|uniref:Coth protein-domain-containing protein n=1 Tax=Syncephalastrum racemosum TaxID=13706 RepID=A0A1X2HTS9_SYNRA|nr:coth protein-domain-containing protein [Syncephalastrum racemosum]
MHIGKRVAFLLAATFATCAVVADVQKNDLTPIKVIHAVEHGVRLGVQVQNDTNVYMLSQSDLDSLLHVGTAPAAAKSYRFVTVHDNGTILDKEAFDRPPSSASLHEFYGRSRADQKAVDALPAFGRRLVERLDDSIVHPQDEIPTMHIKAIPEDLRELYDNYLEDFAISANMSHISGQTSRLFGKLSFNIHINKTSGLSLGGYRKFKLRSCATDPTFMREKLYYDVLAAAGLPASGASYIRLFINQEPIGLYMLVDNYKNPFLRNMYGNNKDNKKHKGKKYKHGVLYQGNMPENPMAPEGLQGGANLEYLGPQAANYAVGLENLYKIQQEASGKKHRRGLEPLIEFMKFINHPYADDEEEQEGEDGTVVQAGGGTIIEAWRRRFDVDTFLRNMALEVLMGHVDGYLGAAHNYFLYHRPETDQFTWMSADLDQTMGNTMIPLQNATSVDRFGLLAHARRPLMERIMTHFAGSFDEILRDFYQALFKTSALRDRTEAIAEFLREDVAWDAQLRQLRINSASTDQKHREQIQQKILQMPLGSSFLERIDAIDFDTALNGPIDNPSLMPLRDWLSQTSEALAHALAS